MRTLIYMEMAQNTTYLFKKSHQKNIEYFIRIYLVDWKN